MGCQQVSLLERGRLQSSSGSEPAELRSACVIPPNAMIDPAFRVIPFCCSFFDHAMLRRHVHSIVWVACSTQAVAISQVVIGWQFVKRSQLAQRPACMMTCRTDEVHMQIVLGSAVHLLDQTQASELRSSGGYCRTLDNLRPLPNG